MDLALISVLLILYYLAKQSSPSTLPPPSDPPPTSDPPPVTTGPTSSQSPPIISIPPVTTNPQLWWQQAKNYKASNSNTFYLPILSYYFPTLRVIREQEEEELGDNQLPGIKKSLAYGFVLGLETAGIHNKTELHDDIMDSINHLKNDIHSGKMTYENPYR